MISDINKIFIPIFNHMTNKNICENFYRNDIKLRILEIIRDSLRSERIHKQIKENRGN